MKYILVGNGIIALTTAFRLCNLIGENDNIIIVGPKNRDGSATLAAAAMLNNFGEIEGHTLATSAGKFHFDLSREAAQLWPSFEEEIIDRALFNKIICKNT